MAKIFSTGYIPSLDEPVRPPNPNATGPVDPIDPTDPTDPTDPGQVVTRDVFDPNTGRVWTVSNTGGSGGSSWQKKEEIAPRTDKHWCKVSLLLNFNFTERPIIVDSSRYVHRILGSSSPTNDLSRERNKFGNSSLRLFGGATSFITVFPDKSLNIANDDFTVETWLYFEEEQDQQGQTRYIYRTKNQNFITTATFGITPTGRLFYSHAGTSTLIANTELPVNEWVHVAVSRTQKELRFFVNGVPDGMFTGVNDPNSFIGEKQEAWLGGNMNAHMDEFRVTKGIGRYVRQFQVPDTAFSAEIGDDGKVDYYWEDVVALFSMDKLIEPGIVADSSQSKLGGVLQNGATLSSVDRKFGSSALRRVARNQYLSCTSSAFSVGGGDDFTVEAWVKIIRSNVYDLINGTGNIFKLQGLSLDLLDYSFTLTIDGQTSTLGLCTEANKTIGQWMHVALVREQSTMRLFVNGRRSGSNVPDVGMPFTGNLLTIGQETSTSIPNSANNRPLIDEFRFTNRVARYLVKDGSFVPSSVAFPSKGEVEPDPYYAGVTLLIASNFLTPGATDFIDASLNESIITTFGSPVVTESSALFRASIQIPTNSCLIVESDLGGSNIEDFTAEAWVNMTSLTGTRTIIRFPGTSWFINNGLLGWESVTSLQGNELTENEWTHVAVSRENGTLRLFKNGEPLTLSSQDPNSSYIDYGEMLIGAAPSESGPVSYDRFLNGFIDQIRVTRGVARYTQDFPVPFRPFGDSGCFTVYAGLMVPSTSVFSVPFQVYD
jgi:hypothetical protein